MLRVAGLGADEGLEFFLDANYMHPNTQLSTGNLQPN